jgi:bleomycin hydrolase
MFASLNTMRYRVIKKYNLKTFELSQAYPLFWDKLEKSNWFLENILDTLDEPLDGRLVSFLLTDPIGDGGQWDMFRSLVKKYGVVPKEAMPETACSRNTGDMDRYLTRYLRGAAKRLRQSHEAGVETDDLRSMKKEMMDEVYHLLATCLGEPPASFPVRLRDKDDKLVLAGTFTPKEFFSTAVDMDVDAYVSLISAPTADKPFGHTYTVSRLGNVWEDHGVRYLNLPPAELKRVAIAQLRDDLPVWFGCDVAQSYLRDEGMMDTAALDVDALFGFPVEGNMDKAERLDYGESLMTHAMVLEGVRLDASGNPELWKVENSWGKDHGRDGFDTLSDAWFDEYVYQVVVDKKYLTEEERHTYETEKPTVLAPWDPMGSLA